MSDTVINNNGGSSRWDKSTMPTLMALAIIASAIIGTGGLVWTVASVKFGQDHKTTKTESDFDSQMSLLKFQIDQDRQNNERSFESLREAIKLTSANIEKTGATVAQQIELVRKEANQRADDAKQEAIRRSDDRFNATEAKIMFLKMALANPGIVTPNPKFKNRPWFYSGMGRETLDGWDSEVRRKSRQDEDDD